jgi:beta-phosphoglucomutase-like phosphatase (HAD superfamily)
MLEYNVDFLFASRHDRYRVALATGATCDTADKVLSSIELPGCFDEIVSGYGVPCHKPAPDVYLLPSWAGASRMPRH